VTVPVEAIVGLVVLAGLTAWGIVLFRRGRARERRAETSSHYESEAGFKASSDSTPHND